MKVVPLGEAGSDWSDIRHAGLDPNSRRVLDQSLTDYINTIT